MVHPHKLESLVRKWDCLFKVKVTAEVQNLLRWCIIISQGIMWKECYANFKAKVTKTLSRGSHIIKIWLFLVFLNCWSFAAELNLMAHHHKPEHPLRKLGCCGQGQGHSKGSYNQNIWLSSTTSDELLILLQTNLVWWYVITSWSVL